MVKTGKGGPYSRKYVKATQDEMRHKIIPECADECAKLRAERGWTPDQYRRCLRECIQRKIKEGT